MNLLGNMEYRTRNVKLPKRGVSVDWTKKAPAIRRRLFWGDWKLNIVVESELPRMGPQINGLHFVFHFVGDPVFDDVRCKHITLQQIVMIGLKCPQDFPQGTRRLRHLGQFFRRQIVNVLVQGLARIDLVLDTVDAAMSMAENAR